MYSIVVCIVHLVEDIAISNYNLLRLDRNRHGGGILLYIRSGLSFSVVRSGPDNLEFLLVTIHNVSHTHANNFCLGVLYNPPDNARHVLSTLTSVLDTLPPSMFSIIRRF